MDHPFHPIAEEYPLMPDHDIGRMTQDMAQRGFDPRFPIILFEGKILDGRNRSIAAKEAKVKPLYVQFAGTEEEARWFVMRANEERRHLAQDWLQRKRKERIERVAQRRQEGASLRVIAEEEGVSPEQIRQDVKASGVNPLTPEVETVTGKDGKQYSARRPEPAETPQRHPEDDVQQHPDDTPTPSTQDEIEIAPPTPSPPATGTLHDSEGNDVPEKLRDVFADTWLADAIATLKKWHEGETATPIIAGIRKRFKHYPWLRLQDAIKQLEAIDRDFDFAIETLRQAVPYTVCQPCGGDGCGACMHSGYLTQWKWEEMQQEG